MIRCPWFDDINTYENEKCQFSCKTMKQLYKHIVDYPHQEIALKLAELVAEKQEPSIPVSVIQAEIARMTSEIDEIENENNEEKEDLINSRIAITLWASDLINGRLPTQEPKDDILKLAGVKNIQDIERATVRLGTLKHNEKQEPSFGITRAYLKGLSIDELKLWYYVIGEILGENKQESSISVKKIEEKIAKWDKANPNYQTIGVGIFLDELKSLLPK